MSEPATVKACEKSSARPTNGRTMLFIGRQRPTNGTQAMTELPDSNFNFDEWQQLYQRDPKAFEARRAAVLEAEIARAPKKNRVRLQHHLAQVEVLCEGKSNQERLEIATALATESMKELSKGLQALRHSLIAP